MGNEIGLVSVRAVEVDVFFFVWMDRLCFLAGTKLNCFLRAGQIELLLVCRSIYSFSVWVVAYGFVLVCGRK